MCLIRNVCSAFNYFRMFNLQFISYIIKNKGYNGTAEKCFALTYSNDKQNERGGGRQHGWIRRKIHCEFMFNGFVQRRNKNNKRLYFTRIEQPSMEAITITNSSFLVLSSHIPCTILIGCGRDLMRTHTIFMLMF